MPKASSRSTRQELSSKDTRRSEVWIWMKPSPLWSGLSQYELSLQWQQQTTFIFCTSTARMPFCMAKVMWKSMSHNQRDLLTNISLRKSFISTISVRVETGSRIWYLYLCGVVVSLGFVPLETCVRNYGYPDTK